MKKCLISILLLFFVSTISFSQNFGFRMKKGIRKTVIPFTTYNNLIIVSLKMNGVEMKFVLDTGIRYTTLVQKVYGDILQLKYDRTIELVGADRNFKMKAHVVNDVDISINGIYNDSESIIILEEDYLEFEDYFGADVQGIIGYDIFSKFVVRIDYDQNRLVIYNSGDFKVPNGFNAYPISIQHSKAYLNADITLHNGDTIKSKLLIDTGASFPLLLDLVSSNKINIPEKHIKSNFGRGLGGTMKGDIGRVKHLNIPFYQLDNIVTFFHADEDFKDMVLVSNRNGSIGGAFLSRFKVILDYEKEVLYLKKGSRYQQQFDYNRSGILLKETSSIPHQYEIEEVLPNSPAAAAGIKKGDFIVRINRLENTLSLQKIRTILKYKARKKVFLRINRGGVLLKFNFRLQELI